MHMAGSSLYDTMAGQGPTSPFIKNEPDDLFDPNRFNKSPDAFGQQNGAHYGPWHGSGVDGLGMDINPAALSQPMTHGQNLPSSFVPGGSAITDDELLSSFDVNAQAHQQNAHMNQQHHNAGHQFQSMNGMNGNFQQHQQMNNQQHMNGYSSTPDGAPIQSPFDRGNFDFGQWQTVNQQGQLATPVSGGIGSMPNDHGKQPMTPMTPHMNGLQLGSSANSNFSGQAMSGRGIQHGRQSSLNGPWDNSLGSGQSHLDSPIGSPGAAMHPQISEVLKSGTPASSSGRGKATTTAEMKKAKRRASHNEVERRRRNHINDRINELAELVPKHRLEDDAIRRSVMSNAAMPMPIGSHSISPPATSGLAGSHGRRAASISQSTTGPVDEKDKGPAKGDVLDGTVDWTRDLLWLVNSMLSRQNEMEHTINNLNGQQPRPYSEEEKRMLSEVQDAIRKNSIAQRQYTRRHGTNLYVPNFTNHAGEPVESPSQAAASPPYVFDLDPPQTVNGSVSGGQYLWNSNAALKEEEELLDFEMN